jgi:hypothetical protein
MGERQMTDIEQKALALVNEVAGIGCYALCDAHPINLIEALCRAIEQHEAFRQEVSDAVQAYSNAYSSDEAAWATLKAFIIPKPKPDPLVEVVKGVTWYDNEITAKEIRAALDAAGFEIREKNDD